MGISLARNTNIILEDDDEIIADALSDVEAKIDQVQTDVTQIEIKTNPLPLDPSSQAENDNNATSTDNLITNVHSDLSTVNGIVDAIKSETDKITSAIIPQTNKIVAGGALEASLTALTTAIVTNRLDSAVYGLSALKDLIDAIQADIGDPTTRTNLKTLQDIIGIPDAVKSLYTLLVTDRLDNGTYGLSSIKAETVEIEKHFHSNERWLGLAAAPSGELHVADGLLDANVTYFTIDAGNNDWGEWVQVIGSSDTPRQAGMTKWDLHEIQMTGNERNADYYFQIGFGTSGAAALAADTYTEKPLTFDGVNVEKFFYIQSRRHDAGSKVWARCKCPGQNTATLFFYIGLHEYLV